MKFTQENTVGNLIKFIVFAIAFYNFAWVYWESLDFMAGRGIGSAWYSAKDFPYAQFLLVLAAYFLFIPRYWSYLISTVISGYFTITWGWMIVKWIYSTDYSLAFRVEIIASQYFGHPLQIWESQIVIAFLIFSFASYLSIKMILSKKSDSHLP